MEHDSEEASHSIGVMAECGSSAGSSDYCTRDSNAGPSFGQPHGVIHFDSTSIVLISSVIQSTWHPPLFFFLFLRVNYVDIIGRSKFFYLICFTLIQ
jgi:hypothetical protein